MQIWEHESSLRGQVFDSFRRPPRAAADYAGSITFEGVLVALERRFEEAIDAFLRHQREQCIGDALAGGQHHAEPAGRLGLEDRGNATEAVGISDAGAAEFVDNPGVSRSV